MSWGGVFDCGAWPWSAGHDEEVYLLIIYLILDTSGQLAWPW